MENHCKRNAENEKSSVRKTGTKKIDSSFYQIVLFVARKNQLLLEIRSCASLMINLK